MTGKNVLNLVDEYYWSVLSLIVACHNLLAGRIHFTKNFYPVFLSI